MFAGNLRYRKE